MTKIEKTGLVLLIFGNSILQASAILNTPARKFVPCTPVFSGGKTCKELGTHLRQAVLNESLFYGLGLAIPMRAFTALAVCRSEKCCP